MTAFYNEIEPFAADWLRALIKGGHIADGVVDERSIVELQASDLEGFTQVHFFAGIGVWSHALRSAGWADDRPVWTGSCPCQPFSSAGTQKGTDDERHLWPHFARLIRACRPQTIFGEQVSKKAGLTWLLGESTKTEPFGKRQAPIIARSSPEEEAGRDGISSVSDDLERAGYAVGAADLSACGVGAPHLRQRLYFVGHAADVRTIGRVPGSVGGSERTLQSEARKRDGQAVGAASPDGQLADVPRKRRNGSQDASGESGRARAEDGGGISQLADARGEGSRRDTGAISSAEGKGKGKRRQARDLFDELEPDGILGRMAIYNGFGRKQHEEQHSEAEPRGEEGEAGEHTGGRRGLRELANNNNPGSQGRGGGRDSGTERTPRQGGLGCEGSDPHHSFWADPDWLGCRDGKWRPTQPGIFPLVDGTSNRVGRLRGYGNAIVAPVAKEFISAFMETQ